MPFRSKSQIKRCEELVNCGKMSQQTFDALMDDTNDPEKLPEKTPVEMDIEFIRTTSKAKTI